MSRVGAFLFYASALALYINTCTATTLEDNALAGDILEKEFLGSYNNNLKINEKSSSGKTNRETDESDWTPYEEPSMGESHFTETKKSMNLRAMLRASRHARSSADENTILPKIPTDLMIKIMREVERRKHGRLNMEDENTLPEILSEISPSRSYVSVGLDLKAISRMIAERQLEKFRRLNGANHQKLLKIGK